MGGRGSKVPSAERGGEYIELAASFTVGLKSATNLGRLGSR